MKIAIKNRHTGKVIHSGDFGRINDCLEDGVSKRGSFRYADLRGANLRGADLEGVNLRGANLEGADLRGVNLRGANLIYANLEGADLRGVNLRGANLIYANLEGADLRGASDIIQFGPIGKRKRICYAVKHEDYVMLKLGCFWGTELEAVKAIKKKYGENSTYQMLVYAACREVENEKY